MDRAERAAARKKARYAAAKKAGICTRCGRAPAENDLLTCSSCTDSTKRGPKSGLVPLPEELLPRLKAAGISQRDASKKIGRTPYWLQSRAATGFIEEDDLKALEKVLDRYEASAPNEVVVRRRYLLGGGKTRGVWGS